MELIQKINYNSYLDYQDKINQDNIININNIKKVKQYLPEKNNILNKPANSISEPFIIDINLINKDNQFLINLFFNNPVTISTNLIISIGLQDNGNNDFAIRSIETITSDKLLIDLSELSNFTNLEISFFQITDIKQKKNYIWTKSEIDIPINFDMTLYYNEPTQTDYITIDSYPSYKNYKIDHFFNKRNIFIIGNFNIQEDEMPEFLDNFLPEKYLTVDELNIINRYYSTKKKIGLNVFFTLINNEEYVYFNKLYKLNSTFIPENIKETLRSINIQNKDIINIFNLLKNDIGITNIKINKSDKSYYTTTLIYIKNIDLINNQNNLNNSSVYEIFLDRYILLPEINNLNNKLFETKVFNDEVIIQVSENNTSTIEETIEF